MTDPTEQEVRDFVATLKPGRRCDFIIKFSVDLDAVPGWGYTPADWIGLATKDVTRQTHYNGTYDVLSVSVDGEVVSIAESK
jgi:hypothetical protein